MKPLITGVILLASCVGLGAWFWSRQSAQSPPETTGKWGAPALAEGFNVVLVTIDTLRADHLGCYGYASAETPRVDRLAANGVRFENVFASAPLTLPSHASILTGKDVPAHGARNNGDFYLTERHTTIAEVLKSNGYATAAFISAYVLDGRYGLSQGFDTYGDTFDPKPRKPSWDADLQRTADETTRHTNAWLKEHLAATSPAPFFLWLHYYDPHSDYEPPPPFASRFKDSPYDGEIAFTDQQLGLVIDELDQAGVRDRTLIVVVADHGESLGEHNEMTHGHLIYDSSMHIPLIVNAPAVIQGRFVVRDRLISTIDVMPTILDLLGVAPPDEVTGISLVSTTPNADRGIYMETMLPLINHGWSSLHAVRRLDGKFIDAPRPEFYDVEVDPGELNNLFDEDPPLMSVLIDALDARMTAWAQAGADKEARLAVDEATLAKLSALGYISTDHGGEDVGTLDPKDMMPFWQMLIDAENIADRGEFDRALSMVRTVTEAWPRDVFALEREADILVRMKRYGEAERVLKKRLGIEPAVTSFVTLGQILIEQSRYKELETILKQAEVVDPEAGAILVLRGDVAARHQQFETALQLYDEAARMDPKRAADMAESHARKVRDFLSQNTGG